MARVGPTLTLVVSTTIGLASAVNGQVVIDMPPPPTHGGVAPASTPATTNAPSTTAPDKAIVNATGKKQASPLARYANRQHAQDRAGNDRGVDIDSIIVTNSPYGGYGGFNEFGYGGYGWGGYGCLWVIVPGYWGSWSGISTCGGGLRTGSFSSFGGLNVQVGF
jgi:hypothetical protein